jgi:hypothetical protein
LLQESAYHLGFIFAHSGPKLDLEFISHQLQGLLDESWVLDNVQVWLSMSDRFGPLHLIDIPPIIH